MEARASHKIRLRFAVALSIGGILYGAAGMALHISLYRLYYADWYIAMMLLGPGFYILSLQLGFPFPLPKVFQRCSDESNSPIHSKCDLFI